jgi:hypothetical protein
MGGVFVSRAFYHLLSAKLSKSKKFNDPETISDIYEKFDNETKLNFSGPEKPEYKIKFGRERDNDESVGIRRGWATFTG